MNSFDLTKRNNNPWLDIASYKIGDAEYFKGREEDKEKYLKIMNNGTMSVLYANSGIGKTSFINASILPEFIKEGYLPIHIIIPEDIYKNGDINAWLYDRICSLKKENETRNIDNFLFWEKNSEGIEILSNPLWWLLNTAVIREGGTSKTYIPFLVFDQFEEIFLKGQKGDGSQSIFIDTFFEIIQGLSSKAMPSAIVKELDEIEQKEGRLLDIECIHRYKVVFSLRKEYLSDFDYWTNDRYIISELLDNRMFLLPLTREQATRVITEQPNPENEGERIDTLNEIKDAILDKIEEKKGDIEPLMLSVLCSRLYEEAKTKGLKQLTKQDVESINMDNLISKFYVDIVSGVITDPRQLSEFEGQMVDKDNHRNKVKSSQILGGIFDKEYEIKKDDKIIKTSYKKELEDKHVIRIERYNDEDYVELIHDRLVDVVVERRKNEERRKKNQQRIQDNLNILEYRGRRLLDNTLDFGGFSNTMVDSPIMEDNRVFHADNMIDFNYRYAVVDEGMVLDSLLSNGREKKGIMQIEYRTDDNIPIRTIEGFNKIKVKYSGSELCVHFIDSKLGNVDKPYYIRGYNGILVKYETYDAKKGAVREIERTYVDEYDKPVMTVDGYAKVVRKYDEFGNIEKVLFYDDQDKQCSHRNGNFGFVSNYNDLGQETRRVFVDKNGEPKPVQSGIYGREFVYNDSDQIVQEINITIQNDSYSPVEDIDGYCAVEFQYDEKNRLSREIYLDKNLKRTKGHNNYCITDTEYQEKEEIIVIERYRDENEVFVKSKNGSYVSRTTYNKRFQLEKDETLDEKMSLTIPNIYNPISIVKCEYKDSALYSVGYYYKTGEPICKNWVQLDDKKQYIEQVGQIDTTRGGYDRIKDENGTFGRLYFRNRRSLKPVSYGFVNQAGKRISTQEGIYECRIEYEKGNITKEFYFDANNKPVKDGLGVYGRYYTYKNDNCVKECHVNENGDLINNVFGYSFKITEYDVTTDLEKKTMYFNKEGKPCPNENGDYAIEYSRDESLLVQTEVGLNQDGMPRAKENGIVYTRITKDSALRKTITEYLSDDKKVIMTEKTIYDDEKHLTTFTTLRGDGEMIADNQGVARVQVIRDEEGRLVALEKFNKNLVPIVDGWGDCVTFFMYHDKGFIMQSRNHKGILHINRKGYAMVRNDLDEYGRTVRQLYYDTDRKPIMSREELYGVEHKYYDCDGYSDCKGEVITHLDERGCPAMNKNGIFKIINEYDKQGGKICQRYYDISGCPIRNKLNHNYFGIKILNDSGKRWQRKVRVDRKMRRKKHKVWSMHVKTEGFFRSSGLEGYFILLKYNDWRMGLSSEELESEVTNASKTFVDIKFIKLSFMDYGMELGDVYHKKIPVGKLGVQLKEIDIPEGIYQELLFVEND